MTEQTGYYAHGLRRMTGRSIHERGRVASTLELLFDLVFAASFAVAGAQLAHGVETGYAGAAVGAFLFGMFAIIWAWINYSWFASAFDTDDWLFRVLTMVQMSGVIVLAIGLPPMFASIEHGEPLANEIMVAGYVVMRVALVTQWLRAARESKYRAAALTYALFVGIAQLGWIVLALLPINLWQTIAGAAICWAIELLGPLVAEAKGAKHGAGSTPWHPHHIAERYALLTIVALGETVIGTIAAADEFANTIGWTWDTIIVIGAGIAMTFALWWTYFMVPSAPVLEHHRNRSFPWGYGHTLIFMSVAAIGAGLHLLPAAYHEDSHVTPFIVMLFIAGPVMVYSFTLFTLHSYLVGMIARNLSVQSFAVLLPIVSVIAAAFGTPLWVCLLLVLASPVSVVFSYELGGWERLERQLRLATHGETPAEPAGHQA